MKIVTHNELGNRISKRLKDLKKNQGWLSERMGLSPEAISKWVNGKTDPALSNLRKAAGMLKCSVGYLAGDNQDDMIAEVARIMESLQPDGRAKVLLGVIAVTATLPTQTEEQTAA